MQKEPPTQTPAQPLKFQALSKGLGFHPFSEGLPYSPQKMASPSNSTLYSQGSGAVSAGPPTFAPAFFKKPTSSMQLQQAVIIPVTSDVARQSALRFSSVFKWVLAFIVDLSFSLIFCGLGLAGAFWKQEISINVLMNSGLFVLSVVFVALAHWPILMIQKVIFHTSVGKRVCGL
ncbi:hypothetical protein WDW86_09970 [Bdellovibrionota bacterium FG-2]